MKVSWLASPPPDAAIESAADAVSAAAVTLRHGQLVVEAYATERLAPGVIAPSMTSRNVAEPEALARAVASVVERLGTSPSRVALVVPDLAGRVSLVRFDQVPSRADDLDQLVRWQLKKSSPFPVEDAVVSYSPSAPQAGGGHEFVVVSARRDVIREYETACEAASLDPGLVDLSTLSILNLFLAEGTKDGRDWLLVHMQPQYTSLAIMRAEHLIFYRNRPEDDEASLADVVHQTTMYHQDRLSGQGFARVLLGGIGRGAGALETARRSLEDRLGVSVEPIDPTREAPLTDRISANADLLAALAPLVGILVRTRREAVAA
ncbi:MAG TPA: pilus assembly protein PilM [Vicinamibacterales bacterium]|nr:pilus assembly protein PilM [Vicinamibacterales bacterium]